MAQQIILTCLLVSMSGVMVDSYFGPQNRSTISMRTALSFHNQAVFVRVDNLENVTATGSSPYIYHEAWYYEPLKCTRFRSLIPLSWNGCSFWYGPSLCTLPQAPVGKQPSPGDHLDTSGYCNRSSLHPIMASGKNGSQVEFTSSFIDEVAQNSSFKREVAIVEMMPHRGDEARWSVMTQWAMGKMNAVDCTEMKMWEVVGRERNTTCSYWIGPPLSRLPLEKKTPTKSGTLQFSNNRIKFTSINPVRDYFNMTTFQESQKIRGAGSSSTQSPSE